MSNVDERVRQVEEMWKKVDALESHVDDVGFTVDEYAARNHASRDVARHRLVRLVNSGKLIKGTRRATNGRWINVFRLPE